MEEFKLNTEFPANSKVLCFDQQRLAYGQICKSVTSFIGNISNLAFCLSELPPQRHCKDPALHHETLEMM